MENSVNIYQRQREFHIYVASKFSDLLRFKKEGDQSSFNNVLLKAMPAIKLYVLKNLNRAMATGKIDKNKYSADDFIDQLFIEVYDHIDEIDNEKELYLWMYKKVDELLDDILVEEEFDSVFFENIDNYSKLEWDAMEEKFSTDGDGDLVMIDDISYAKKDYVLNHVFIEDNNRKVINQLDNELDNEDIRKHSETVMRMLPTPMQKVYDLFTDHQFTVAEIAKIRNSTIQEVELLLEAAKKSLRSSFMKRFVE